MIIYTKGMYVVLDQRRRRRCRATTHEAHNRAGDRHGARGQTRSRRCHHRCSQPRQYARVNIQDGASMRFIAVVFLLAVVSYGIWSFDRKLMLGRRRVVVVTCAPTSTLRM